MTTPGGNEPKDKRDEELNRLREAVEVLTSNLKLVEKATDQRLLSKERAKLVNEDEIVRQIRLRTFNGDVIVERSNLVMDEVIAKDGSIYENQQMDIFVGAKKEKHRMSLMEYANNTTLTEPVSILGRTEKKDSKGITRSYITTSYNGTEYIIDARFVN